MTITRKQLINAMNNANKLNNLRDSSILEDMARSLKKWKALTSGQAEFAAVLIERNSNEKASKIDEELENHRIMWQEDGAYREWVKFLATFFLTSRQTAYMGHINNRKPNARNVLRASKDLDGKPPTHFDCNRLTSSKLADRLRKIYDHPPIYSLGELVSIRHSEISYWDLQQGAGKEMGFITEIEPNPVDTVGTYNKTKGGTKTYRIMFTHREAILRENQIKRVSRKNHNKGK